MDDNDVEVKVKLKATDRCVHGKQKRFCAECGGTGLCVHGKRKHLCIE